LKTNKRTNDAAYGNFSLLLPSRNKDNKAWHEDNSRKMILQPSHLGQLGIRISLWLYGRHQMQHGPAYLGFAI